MEWKIPRPSAHSSKWKHREKAGHSPIGSRGGSPQHAAGPSSFLEWSWQGCGGSVGDAGTIPLAEDNSHNATYNDTRRRAWKGDKHDAPSPRDGVIATPGFSTKTSSRRASWGSWDGKGMSLCRLRIQAGDRTGLPAVLHGAGDSNDCPPPSPASLLILRARLPSRGSLHLFVISLLTLR